MLIYYHFIFSKSYLPVQQNKLLETKVYLNKNPISHMEVNSYYASKNSKIDSSKFQNIGARSYTIDNIENEPNFIETKKVQKSQ